MVAIVSPFLRTVPSRYGAPNRWRISASVARPTARLSIGARVKSRPAQPADTSRTARITRIRRGMARTQGASTGTVKPPPTAMVDWAASR